MARNVSSWHGLKKDTNSSPSRPPLPPRPTSQQNPAIIRDKNTNDPTRPLTRTASEDLGATARPVSIATDLEESLLQCDVCFEPYTTPKALRCQHVFCLNCLVRWLERGSPRGQGSMACPTCRTVSRVPSGGLTNLPAAHLVNTLADLTKKYKERKDSDQSEAIKDLCTFCKDTGNDVKATRFCFNCVRQMCDSCAGKHNRQASFKNHVSTNIAAQSIGAVICSEHEDHFITSFCLKCNVPVCTTCLMNKHFEHQHVGFISATNDIDTSSATTGTLRNVRTILEKEKEKCSDMRSKYIQERNSFKDSLQRHYDRQLELLREEQFKLLREADEFFEDVEEKIHRKDKRIDKGLAQLQQHEDSHLHSTNPLQGLKDIALETTSTNVEVLVDELKDLSSTASLTVSCRLKPGPTLSLGSVDSLCVFPNSEASASGASAITTVELDPHGTDEVKWQVNECKRIMCFCLLDNSSDTVALTIGWPKLKLECFGKDGKKRSLPNFLKKNEHFMYRLNNCDNYTAILNKSETETFSILLYKKEKHVSTITHRGEGEPRAIVVRSNGEVIMANIKPQSICCYSAKGDQLWLKKKSHVDNPGHFEFPISILNNRYNQIIIADPDGHQLHVYDTRGDHLFSFPQEINETFQPVSACMDGDHIIVALKAPLRTISKFDASGTLIKHLVRLPYDPTSITCLVDQRLLVVGTWDMGLKAYDLKELEE